MSWEIIVEPLIEQSVDVRCHEIDDLNEYVVLNLFILTSKQQKFKSSAVALSYAQENVRKMQLDWMSPGSEEWQIDLDRLKSRLTNTTSLPEWFKGTIKREANIAYTDPWHSHKLTINPVQRSSLVVNWIFEDLRNEEESKEKLKALLNMTKKFKFPDESEFSEIINMIQNFPKNTETSSVTKKEEIVERLQRQIDEIDSFKPLVTIGGKGQVENKQRGLKLHVWYIDTKALIEHFALEHLPQAVMFFKIWPNNFDDIWVVSEQIPTAKAILISLVKAVAGESPANTDLNRPSASTFLPKEDLPKTPSVINQELGEKDWFVSYNKADRQWAEWVAWQLEEAGYSVIIQEWDFRPGSNFILEMQKASKLAERTIALLSPDYLAAKFPQPEWAAAFAQDPTGSSGKLLPVRVRECQPEGLLRSIVYVDLVGQDAQAAKDILLNALSRGRAKPTVQPAFPGLVSRGIGKPAFPGGAPSGVTQGTPEKLKTVPPGLFGVFGLPVRDIAQNEFHNIIHEKRAVVVQIGSRNPSCFPVGLRRYFENVYSDRVLLGYLDRELITKFDIFKRKYLDTNKSIEHQGRDGYYMFIDGRLIDFHSGVLEQAMAEKISTEIKDLDPQFAKVLFVVSLIAVGLSDDPAQKILRLGNRLAEEVDNRIINTIIEQFEAHLIKFDIH